MFRSELRKNYARTEAAARAMVRIARRIRVVASATPLNLGDEVSRLTAVWERGQIDAPRFRYGARRDHAEEKAGLAAALEAYHGPLRELYAARVAELVVEAEACEAVGTEAFWGLARRRHPRRDAFDGEADRTAERWVQIAPPEAGAGVVRIASDDESDARSLVSAMRRAVGEQRLPLRVRVSRAMAPLAATGEGVIYVSAGRMLTVEDAARTVVHEVFGHALPEVAARRSPLPLFELGTAFGSDDQEGWALELEQRAGMLSSARRREIALRHRAARAVEAAAPFAALVDDLRAHGAEAPEAIRIAARVLRGGGLAREVAYLPALLRVRAALREAPELGAVLASGRVSVDAARELAPHVLDAAPSGR